MKKVQHLLIVIFLAFSLATEAQTNTSSTGKTDSVAEKKNVFTANVNYQSRLHYFGRTDELQSSGLFPSISYELKEGFYAKSNFIFINNRTTSLSYNGSVIEGGYKFPESKHFSGNIFYSQFIYKDESQLVQSALRSQTGINAAYNNKIVNLNLGGDAKFSDRTDFGATAGLDHLFIHVIPKKKQAIAFNPSAYVYAGTQNFSTSYIIKNRAPGLLGLPIGGGESQNTVTEEKTKFNILAYEFSAPIVFVAGKFNASITPSYVMPQNLVKVDNRPDLSETGKNMFYITAGVGVRL
jgi:hypothetical protein